MRCHGEYKVPGGKLVVADFRFEAGILVDVEISGDFFLYPDEAIHWISAALSGAPADSDAVELARRIRLVLGPEVEMLGFDADAVAEAVRRGLA
ncbi:MAG: biotin--protein ligase [Gemmataceae bacterium]